MSYRLTHIHGLGPVHQLLLHRHNVRNTEHLIHVTSDPDERRRIARATGLPERELKRWRNFAQLMRIPGIGPSTAALLTEAGIENLAQLAEARPDDLLEKLSRAAEIQGWQTVRSEKIVRRWIDDARTLMTGTAAA
jgi:predicted flap endonuclease-1-like 5' DNA nuclease